MTPTQILESKSNTCGNFTKGNKQTTIVPNKLDKTSLEALALKHKDLITQNNKRKLIIKLSIIKYSI